MSQMRPGQKAVIRQDILIDGQLVLRTGDQVIIQKVLRRLGWSSKYAVYSNVLESLIWIDSRKIATPAIAKPKRNWRLYLLIACPVIAVILLVVLCLFFVYRPHSITPNQAYEELRNCSGELQQYADAMRGILSPDSQLAGRNIDGTKLYEQYSSTTESDNDKGDSSLEGRLKALAGTRSDFYSGSETYKIGKLPTSVKQAASKYLDAFDDISAVAGLENALVNYCEHFQKPHLAASFGTVHVDSNEVEEGYYILYLSYSGDFVTGQETFQWGERGRETGPLDLEYDLIKEAMGQKNIGDTITAKDGGSL